MVSNETHCCQAIMHIVFGVELAQRQHRPVMLLHHLHRAGSIVDMDWRAACHEIEKIDGLVVLAHVVEALGRASMIVEGDARRNHINEGSAAVLDRGLDDRNELLLVAGTSAPRSL